MCSSQNNYPSSREKKKFTMTTTLLSYLIICCFGTQTSVLKLYQVNVLIIRSSSFDDFVSKAKLRLLCNKSRRSSRWEWRRMNTKKSPSNEDPKFKAQYKYYYGSLEITVKKWKGNLHDRQTYGQLNAIEHIFIWWRVWYIRSSEIVHLIFQLLLYSKYSYHFNASTVNT